MKRRLKILVCILPIFLLWYCRASLSGARIYIESSDYKYKNVRSKSPRDIAGAIVKDGESNVVLVICPGAPNSMIFPLEDVLSLNSGLAIYLVNDDCA